LDRIEQATDIRQLIVDMKEIKTYMASTTVKRADYFMIEHQHKNIIHLDTESSDNSSGPPTPVE
jgi:hypothetical protein